MTNVYVNGGVVSNGVVLSAYDNMFVSSGGTANNTYDLRGIENLTIAMERGTIKASFFDENHTAVDLDGQSSFTIAADSDPKKNSRFFDSISEEVKFLKIEAAANGTNSYRLNSALA